MTLCLEAKVFILSVFHVQFTVKFTLYRFRLIVLHLFCFIGLKAELVARLHSYFLSVGGDYKSAMSAVFNKIRPPHSCAETRLIKFDLKQQRIQSAYLVLTSVGLN